MDDRTRVVLKGKFAALVILLNIMIFSAAAAVLVWALVPEQYWFRMPVVIAGIILVLVSVLIFIPKYRKTKKWLAIHGTTKEERLARAQKEEDEYRARVRAELEEELRREAGEQKTREE
jgi:uncharacterized membrane protein